MRSALIAAALIVAGLPLADAEEEIVAVTAPAWIAVAMDLAEGASVDLTFGLRSSGALLDGSASVFIHRGNGFERYRVGFTYVEGEANGAHLMTGENSGSLNVSILGGPAEPWNRYNDSHMSVRLTDAPADRWFFVFVGGARAEGAELYADVDAPVPYDITWGNSAFYAFRGEDFEAAGTVKLAAQAQHVAGSVVGSFSFNIMQRAYFAVSSPWPNCVCRLDGAGEGGEVAGWGLNGFRSWNGPPGQRTVSYLIERDVSDDPTAHPNYGARPYALVLLAADVTLPI